MRRHPWNFGPPGRTRNGLWNPATDYRGEPTRQWTAEEARQAAEDRARDLEAWRLQLLREQEEVGGPVVGHAVCSCLELDGFGARVPVCRSVRRDQVGTPVVCPVCREVMRLEEAGQ